jgi:hypothetical protein
MARMPTRINVIILKNVLFLKPIMNPPPNLISLLNCPPAFGGYAIIQYNKSGKNSTK